ncbi:MAG: anti-sigma factor [Bacteroidota bacterium]
MMVKNAELSSDLRSVQTKNVILEEQSSQAESELAEANTLLEVMRSKDYLPVALPGNTQVAPDAFATVYFNAETNTGYVDASGLPTPPKGKVYQVWSLIMDPLTPRSIAVLDTFESSTNKFFKMENIPAPEAFGITLEPEGGSESPTLSQLYTIGTIAP